MEPAHKWDEKDIYREEPPDEDAPRPVKRGHPALMVAFALFLTAGWGAWLLHQRAEARRAAELAELQARAAGLPGAVNPDGTPSAAAPVPKPDPVARPAQVPPAPPPNYRRFYGVVFDLATRKPVSGAGIVLSLGEKDRVVNPVPCQASLNGHFACDVSDQYDGLGIHVSSGGYVGQFEDLQPSLLERPEAERSTILAQRDGYLEPTRLLYVTSQETVRVDLAAVPADWAAAAQSKR